MKKFAVTALLVALVTMTSSAPSVKEKRSADSSCSFNGQTWDDGSTFSLPGQSPCIIYRCTQGSISFESGSCQDSNTGACHAADEVWPAGPCSTYKCHVETSGGSTYYQTKIDTLGCQSPDGTCRANGETWNVGCFTYQCVASGNSISSNLVDGGCQDSTGTCRAVGETWQASSGCSTYKCILDGNTYRSVVDTLACQTSDGQCHPVGEEWVKSCRTYTCSTEVKDGKTQLVTSITTTNCQDADGVCRTPQETFPLMIGATRYETCTCTVVQNSVSYSCSG